MGLGELVRNVFLTTATVAAAATATAGEQVKYFGFTGAEQTLEDTQRTSPYTNILLVDVDNPILRNKEWVDEMVLRGIGVFLGVHNDFFELVEPPVIGGNQTPNDNAPIPDTKEEPMFDFRLRADYRERWAETVQSLEYAIKKVVDSTYNADEPCWLQIERYELVLQQEAIKELLPGMKTMISYNRKVTEECLEGKPLVADRWGFHMYVEDPRTDQEYQEKFQLVQSHAGEKEMILVFYAFNNEVHRGQGIYPEDMGTIALNYFAWGETIPHLIGYMGFDWRTKGTSIGAGDFPEDVQQIYREKGADVTGKCLIPEGVQPEHPLFFDDCRLYGIVTYADTDGIHNANALPIRKDFGTWVQEDGNLMGGLNLKEDNGELILRGAFFDTNEMRIDLYNTASGERVWSDGDHILRVPYTQPRTQVAE